MVKRFPFSTFSVLGPTVSIVHVIITIFVNLLAISVPNNGLQLVVSKLKVDRRPMYGLEFHRIVERSFFGGNSGVRKQTTAVYSTANAGPKGDTHKLPFAIIFSCR